MADVILADGKLTPRAIVSQVTLDWACGTDENDFELTIDDPDAPEIERGWYFWLDGSDVGGRIIDRRVTVSGGVSTAMWIGQSWTGMLAAKILQPDANQDYLTVSGKLPDILKSLLKLHRFGFGVYRRFLRCFHFVELDVPKSTLRGRLHRIP